MNRRVPRDKLVLSIDLGNGNTGVIQAQPHDSAEVLARDFCKKHRLHAQLSPVIAKEVRQSLVHLSRLTKPQAIGLPSKRKGTRAKDSRSRQKQPPQETQKKEVQQREFRVCSKPPVPKHRLKQQNKELSGSQLTGVRGLFSRLSQNQSCITQASLTTAEVPRELIEALQPLLTEVKELGTALTYQDFCERLELLKAVLGPAEQRVLQTFPTRSRLTRSESRHIYY